LNLDNQHTKYKHMIWN